MKLFADTNVLASAFGTGDKALLEMGSVKGMPIVSPRQMYERLLRGA